MKPNTAKPSEPRMKFFTPELFIKSNSPDDATADQADEEWENAIREYERHLRALEAKMPSEVEQLTRLILHDAELLPCEQPGERFPATLGPVLPYLRLSRFPQLLVPAPCPNLALLSLKQGDEILSLIYQLLGRVRSHEPMESWPFSKLRTHWLYDEVDLDPTGEGAFLHRVLLSDGTVLEIPFISVLIQKSRLQDGHQADSSKQIA